MSMSGDLNLLRLMFTTAFDDGFRFLWLPMGSVVILTICWYFKLTRYRVAWYMATSAPGLIVLPFFIALSFQSAYPLSWTDAVVGVGWLSLLFPAAWICPVIFG